MLFCPEEIKAQGGIPIALTVSGWNGDLRVFKVHELYPLSCCLICAQNCLLGKVIKREAQSVEEKDQMERIRNFWKASTRRLPERSKFVKPELRDVWGMEVGEEECDNKMPCLQRGFSIFIVCVKFLGFLF